MDIPHLVREHLDGEAIEATVGLGDEDVVCITPSRALVYRGEGLLSDESVESYALNVERFDISQSRRKTKFIFEYIDGTESVTVPGSRADSLLRLLLQGILRVDGVIDDEESVAGVYQFSELTLVVAESRLVKHIGSTLWDEDFEVYDYDDVTDLDFEEGSVATQIVITVDGRPQRIKAPNDEAPQVERTLLETLCTYFEVSSPDQLMRTFAESESDDDDAAEPAESAAGDIGLEAGISPLVGETDPDTADADADEADALAETATETSADPEPAIEEREAASPAESAADRETSQSTPPAASADGVDPEDIEAMQEQLAALTKVVKRQNELLKQQDDRIKSHDDRIEQLIEELRRGR